MLPPTFYVVIGVYTMLHGVFKPSSTITMFSSHAVLYMLYCLCGLPKLLEAAIGVIVALLIHYISMKESVTYYVKMWIYHLFLSMTSAAYLPVMLIRPLDDHINNIRLIWKKTLPIFGITVEVRNAEYLQGDGPCVIVSNHQSSLDLISLVHAMPPSTTALAKKELKYMGPFGLVAWFCGLIFVDRSNRSKAISTMKNVATTMKERKVNIWIFPEGTRNMNGKMLPFKKGAFHLAIEAQVPIVAVVISSYKNFLDYSIPKMDKGRVIVSCLPHFSTEGMELKDIDVLLKKVQKEMNRVFHETSLEVNSSHKVLPVLDDE